MKCDYIDRVGVKFFILLSCVFYQGKRESKQKPSKNPNIRAPGTKAKNIKSMFAAAAVNCKKKPEVIIANNTRYSSVVVSMMFVDL